MRRLKIMVLLAAFGVCAAGFAYGAIYDYQLRNAFYRDGVNVSGKRVDAHIVPIDAATVRVIEVDRRNKNLLVKVRAGEFTNFGDRNVSFLGHTLVNNNPDERDVALGKYTEQAAVLRSAVLRGGRTDPDEIEYGSTRIRYNRAMTGRAAAAGMDSYDYLIDLYAGRGFTVDIEAPPAIMVFVEGDINNDSFYIGKYEVTWKEWVAVRDWAVTRGYDLAGVGESCSDDHPVHSVNWYDSVKWCNARSEMQGLPPVYTVGGNVYRTGDHDVVDVTASATGYRLPTIGEWLHAARGGTLYETYTYAGSDTLDDVGWYTDNSAGSLCNLFATKGPWPVGQKNPNGLGIHDMSGNVIEFIFYNFPAGQAGMKGGSWWSLDWVCAIDTGMSGWAVDRLQERGLRVVRNAP